MPSDVAIPDHAQHVSPTDTALVAVSVKGTPMTIPDYIISQTIAWEHQANQQRATPDPGLPTPRRRQSETSDRLARFRRQLADTLHSIANRIEQEPAGSR